MVEDKGVGRVICLSGSVICHGLQGGILLSCFFSLAFSLVLKTDEVFKHVFF